MKTWLCNYKKISAAILKKIILVSYDLLLFRNIDSRTEISCIVQIIDNFRYNEIMVYSRSYGIYILHTNVDLKKIVILFYFTQHHVFDIMCCIYIYNILLHSQNIVILLFPCTHKPYSFSVILLPISLYLY